MKLFILLTLCLTAVFAAPVDIESNDDALDVRQQGPCAPSDLKVVSSI